MTIAELTIYNKATGWQNSDCPYVFNCAPAYRQYASYWLEDFGAFDDQRTIKILITDILRDGIERYLEQNTLADCKANEGSFYWDHGLQKLHVHFEHEYSPTSCEMYYGAVKGFTDDTVRYYNDIEYLPLISKAPKYSKQVDFQNYDRLSFLTGTLVLHGDGAILDNLIEYPLAGNEVNILFGEPDDDYDDLIQMDSFYVDDFKRDLSSLSLSLQDQRVSQDVDVPVEVFSVDDYPDIEEDYYNKVIPVVYHEVHDFPCTPVNGLETVGSTRRYRCALLATENPTNVMVKIDDAWVARTPSSISLTTGEFDVPNAITDEGAPYECKCDFTGITITYASDIVVDLNDRFIDVEYLASNYERTEWEQEEIYLDPIGFAITEKKKLFDVIAELQKSTNLGFIYDIKYGKRTIRVDNPNRDVTTHIQKCELLNVNKLPISSDPSFLYSEVEVNYDKNWAADSFDMVNNDDYESAVITKHSNRNKFVIDTYLASETAAQSRADIDAENYSDVREVAECEIMGLDYFSLRLFDIVTVEFTDGFVDYDADTITGREYYGVVRGQIIKIIPDFGTGVNKIYVRKRAFSNVFYNYHPNRYCIDDSLGGTLEDTYGHCIQSITE